MSELLSRKRELIIVDPRQVHVVNSRFRNAQFQLEFNENVAGCGLGRPIVITKRHVTDSVSEHILVCGEGRLQSYLAADAKSIPAMLIEASEEEALIMSLAENIARKHRSPLELIMEVDFLRSRGMTHGAISKTIGVAQSWVSGVLRLIEYGEARLLASVAEGVMPISIAAIISRGSDSDLQVALARAYEDKTLRGAQLVAVRRVIKLRESNRLIGQTRPGGPAGHG